MWTKKTAAAKNPPPNTNPLTGRPGCTLAKCVKTGPDSSYRFLVGTPAGELKCQVGSWRELETKLENNTMADINKIAEELGTLTILEAADLVKLLEEKWGVSAAAPVAAAAAAAPAEAEEEKTEFNVVLTEARRQQDRRD